MKKLLLLWCIVFAHHSVASVAKPTLLKPVEDTGFGKAIDAGNFQDAFNIFKTKVGGAVLRKNALQYLYMTVDMPGLKPEDQNLVVLIIKDTPSSFSADLPIAPMNRKWLAEVLPEYSIVTKVDTDAPPISQDPRQIGNWKRGFSYEGLVNFWNKGDWAHATSMLETMDFYIPRLVNKSAFKSLLQLLFGNIPYEVWVKMDADPRSRLAALAHKHGVATPAAAVGPLPPPAHGPIPPPAPAPLRKENVVIADSPYSYASVKKAWEGKQWDFVRAGFIAFDMHVPQAIPRDVMQAIVEDLLKATSPVDWASMAPEMQKDFEYILKQYGHEMPRVPASVPPPPDISTEPVYSYEVAKKAWQAHRWQIALTNLQNFEASPGVFTNKPMREIVAEMISDTSLDEWNKIASGTRNGLEKLLKQYGVNPPMKPALPVPPRPATVDDARAAWTRKTRSGQADSEGLNVALAILESFAKRNPRDANFRSAVAELVKYADNAYWSNLTPDQPKRINALAKITQAGEPPLPPIPGQKPPKPLPPTPQKPPAPKPGPLPPLPIEALYQKLDVALKGDNVRGALEVILKEALPTEIKRALIRILIEVHPKKLLTQKDLLRSILVRLSAADQDELIRTFEVTITGPDVRPLATFLRTGALPGTPPLPPIPGPKPSTPLPPTPHTPPSPPLGPLPPVPGPRPAPSSDAKTITAALTQDFDTAVQTLHTGLATDSADFRTAIANLFTKTKLGFKNEQERDAVLDLVKKAYPEKDARDKFYSEIPAGLRSALRKAEEIEDEEPDEEPIDSPSSSRVPTPVPHPKPPMPMPDPHEKPKQPQPSQPSLPSGLAAQDARNLKAAHNADFDVALNLLNKVIVNDSEEFRAALGDLFSKKKERITDDQATIIWKLISKAFSDGDERNKFLGTLPAHIQEALKKENW